MAFAQSVKDIQNGASDQKDAISAVEESIQARLDFLAAMYSNDITPDHFRKDLF